MTIKYVEFSNSKKTLIVSEFDSPQDPSLYEFQEEIEETDPRYQEFVMVTSKFLATGSTDN